jgi:hypothetical protein
MELIRVRRSESSPCSSSFFCVTQLAESLQHRGQAGEACRDVLVIPAEGA